MSERFLVLLDAAFYFFFGFVCTFGSSIIYYMVHGKLLSPFIIFATVIATDNIDLILFVFLSLYLGISGILLGFVEIGGLFHVKKVN